MQQTRTEMNSSGNSGSCCASKSRGPYRQVRRTPRQTVFNRVKRTTTSTSHEPPSQERHGYHSEDDEESAPRPPVQAAQQARQDHDDANEIVSHETNVFAEAGSDPGSLQCNDEHPTTDCSAVSGALLYSGSSITATDSQLVLRSFMSRYHLTKQAKEDLDVVRVHIPQLDNTLPRSLYCFRNKFSESHSTDAMIKENFYCQSCYSPIENEGVLCPNLHCCFHTSYPSEYPSFITLSIAEQLNMLLKRTLCIIINITMQIFSLLLCVLIYIIYNTYNRPRCLSVHQGSESERY